MRVRLGPAAALALLFVLAGCSDAQDAVNDATTGAVKARDCAQLASDTLQSRIADAQQVDQQEVEQAAQRLADRIDQIQDTDLKSAAESLRASLQRAADAAAQGDTSALQKAREQAVAAARRAAGECGIPVDRFTG
ncbi:hypothetical protein [Motilibacter deserti]|uniref:Secreted protein n=1 Tax=Motilibacter deserti TaxID=2714956 RepID=A0ABX0GRH5_9ACTN|nr:hypothetical protein [Motilibacter deserti]NHC13073.1 hypothetical protein [Motilibacter deserti]